MATLEQIQSRIAKLQLQADAVRQKENSAVISRIVKLLSDHGLTVDDLHAAPKARRGRPSLKNSGSVEPKKRGRPSLKLVGATGKGKSTPKKKSVLPDKYRNPKTGETWSGWARAPEWIRDVKDRSKFLINPGNDTPITLGRRKRVRKAA